MSYDYDSLNVHSATLRFTPLITDQQDVQVEIAFQKRGVSIPSAIVTTFPPLTAQEQEDLRWYLEDYLQYSFDPAPLIAARIEKRFDAYGRVLFQDLFQCSEESRRIWAAVSEDIAHTRVEIVSHPSDIITIPWEWLRDPTMDDPLAICAQSFVRIDTNAMQRPASLTLNRPIRILLVICRPGRGEDPAPFRSVASRLIKALGEREDFQLEVLRPSSFSHLAERLQAAHIQGQPYHIVHFDGHGVYTDLVASAAGVPSRRLRGYVVFENPATPTNREYIHGTLLAKQLIANGVPLLLLNACRSAHAEVSAEPGKEVVVERVHAFGSFAQEAVSAGMTGVVAMSYNVYVETAAHFVANLYAGLASGKTLGEAVTEGRNLLYSQPLRENGLNPHTLQDWVVPVVYEDRPTALLFSSPVTGKATRALVPMSGLLDAKLPPVPSAGFIGRDETFLSIDRAFDSSRCVLLHAYAGSGKTSTVAEFARWYSLTYGTKIVIYTSFERYKSLAQVIDETEPLLSDLLSQQGKQWLALNDEQRCNEVLQLLRQIPVLWIWDNVEAIAGFPEGFPSSWTSTEHQELKAFLQDAMQAEARLLLASRRDEHAWLGDLPLRVAMPPMPMLERVQMVRALVEQQAQHVVNIQHWWPLLVYSQGNPLMLTVTVRQALREGLQSREQMASFVEQLHAGEVAFTDEASEGRSRSLGASLSYGFDHSFSDMERKELALLSFFQGFVDGSVVAFMTDPDNDASLPAADILPLEQIPGVLDRAAEVGLLTTLSGGYYAIHPALPWFLKNLLDQYYPSAPAAQDGSENLRLAATHAFVAAEGSLANLYHGQYEGGNRERMLMLAFEEANLLHARRLALTNGWWKDIIGPMQGLRVLYSGGDRWATWTRLVNEVLPLFCDPTTDGPLPGRERLWSLVMGYRVELARRVKNDLEEALQLQRIRVEWGRRATASLLALPAASLEATQRELVRGFAVALEDLAHTLRDMKQRECFDVYHEAFQLFQNLDAYNEQGVISLNLAEAHFSFNEFDQCETWVRLSLLLLDEHDRLMRGECYSVLGKLYLEKGTIASQMHLKKASANDQGQFDSLIPEMIDYLQKADEYYTTALQEFPSDALEDLAEVHTQLGMTYMFGSSIPHLRDGGKGFRDLALEHQQEAIRYLDKIGNRLQAAYLRVQTATLLFLSDRLDDAQIYAQAALTILLDLGDKAAKQAEGAQELLQNIEQARTMPSVKHWLRASGQGLLQTNGHD